MSLILDALRKSEAERRRGEAPALSLELPPAPLHATPGRAWWIALPVGLLLAVLAIWQLRSNDPAVAAQDTSALPATAAPAASTDPRAEVPGWGAAPAPVPVRTPVPATVPAPSPAAAPDPADAAAPRSEAAPARPDPPDERALPAPASRPLPDGTPAVAQDDGTLSLADLPAAERQALPPLKLSMHVWSADPAGRFVILDGHRLAEGDRAGPAVVERIVPDGVVLVTGGRRLHVPLP